MQNPFSVQAGRDLTLSRAADGGTRTIFARWGAETARHLPNSLHLVFPGGHGVSGPAVDRVELQFLESGTMEGLDLSVLAEMKWPPLSFRIPDSNFDFCCRVLRPPAVLLILESS